MPDKSSQRTFSADNVANLRFFFVHLYHYLDKQYFITNYIHIHMKRFLLFVLSAAACIQVACINEQFDLTNIESDGITIGGDESEFLMPLITIKFTSGDISQNVDEGFSSIMGLREQINVWLPSKLPNNANYVDIKALNNNPTYLQSILDALFAEMHTDKAKRLEVASHVMTEFRAELIEQLSNSGNATLKTASSQLINTSIANGAEILAQLFVSYPNEIEGILQDMSAEDLIDINLENIDTEIPALDISEDIEQMLTENLDPSSEENAVNALYLFGETKSGFPFQFRIRPTIEYTDIDLGNILIDSNTTTPIDDVRIYREDLQTLFNGSQLVMPISLERYYPNEQFNDNSEISISISLRKTGGLNI